MSLWQCTSTCGWVAAIISALAFGSFGVPIKSGKSNKVNVDPLVMQSYKTFMLFVTCWFVLWMGEDCSVTAWGLASGCFAIPGGAAGIYGIRNAGLAIAVGTWSSLIVISSFAWGILVFHEEVRSIPGAFVACLLLMVGLVGMARYSSPALQSNHNANNNNNNNAIHHHHHSHSVVPAGSKIMETTTNAAINAANTSSSSSSSSALSATSASTKTTSSSLTSSSDEGREGTAAKKRKAAIVTDAKSPKSGGGAITTSTTTTTTTVEDKELGSGVLPLELESDDDGSLSAALLPDGANESGGTLAHDRRPLSDASIVLFNGRFILSRRQMGIIGAVFNGLWGGTSMIPLHYANKQGYGGARYIISFSCGSAVVCVVIWCLRFLFQVYATQYRYREAYNSLPSFHIKEMWLPGMLTGAMYSLGNYTSIIAITYLGQGIGYSVVQSAMLVSGLWGIFFFGEIRGAEIISKWLLAAVITIAGILLLSHEHVDSGGGGH